MPIPGPLDRLGAVLRRQPGCLFAVLDGGHFEDLPRRLRAVGLDYQPLYVDETDAPQLAAGPHLVVCKTWYAVERVRDVCAGTPSVVWWFWPDEPDAEMALYRHLRRLNLMDVPEDPWGRSDPSASQVGGVSTPGDGEPVLFRYADPDVVAAILPVLAPVQRARFFGGALALASEPASFDGVFHIQNPAHAGNVPFGRLRLSPHQYAQLGAALGKALRRRAVIEFTRQVKPGQRAARSAQVIDAVDRAEYYGCTARAHVWEFIEWDIRHGPRFELTAKFRGVLAQLKDADLPAEEKIFRANQELQFVERHGMR